MRIAIVVMGKHLDLQIDSRRGFRRIRRLAKFACQGRSAANVIGFVLERGSPSAVICGRDGVPWMWCGVPVGSARTLQSFHAVQPQNKDTPTIAHKASESPQHHAPNHITSSLPTWVKRERTCPATRPANLRNLGRTTRQPSATRRNRRQKTKRTRCTSTL